MEDINFLKSSADFAVVQGKPLASWAKFVGIVTIILGAISCLGIISAAVGIPMIFSGLRLLKAYDDMKRFSESNSYYNLSNAIENLNGFFRNIGILFIVYLAFLVLYIGFLVFFIIFIGFGAHQLS
ncbi:MAG: DUF5362 family protein [Bacillota bacterium]|nr:DUF5362 family protein [Bacillota bacterium]